MTEAETQGSSMGEIISFVYTVTILVIGFFVLLLWLTRHGSRLRTVKKVPGWHLSWVDFGWYVMTLILVVLVGAELGAIVAGGNVIAGSVLMAAGAVGATLSFLYTRSPRGERRLSAAGGLLAASARWGLGGFLATPPLVFVVTLLTLLLFQLLRLVGIDVVPESQDIIEIISEAEGVAQIVLLVFLAVVVAPLWEEIVFRGGLYRFLKTRLPLPVAMVLSAAMFSMVHSYALGFLALVMVGVVLCVVYEQSGDIRAPIFLHALFNANSLIVLFLQGGEAPEMPF